MELHRLLHTAILKCLKLANHASLQLLQANPVQASVVHFDGVTITQSTDYYRVRSQGRQ